MNANTQRGLDNAISLLLSTGEFDRLRLFLISDNSTGRGESEEIIRHICDEIRAHLLTHQKAVAAAKRGL